MEINYVSLFRGRAFLYQDGDANIKPPIGKKNRDGTYRKALEEANDIHQRLKIERAAAENCGPRGLKPAPYVKLKVKSFFSFLSFVFEYTFNARKGASMCDRASAYNLQ